MMFLKSMQTAPVLTLAALAVTPAISLAQSSPQTVSIQFAAKVGERPFSCSESYLLGTANTQVMPTDFRLYVSEVALIDADGNAVPLELEQDGQWQYQNVALLDFEDRTGACANGTVETRNQVVGTVPAGGYQGLRFTLGVPFDLNHEDATLAPSPLNLTSLWWNWRGGYKFLRVDLENHTVISDRSSLEAKNGATSHSADKPGGEHPGHPSQPDPGHGDGHSVHGDQTAAPGIAIHIGSTGCQIEGDRQQPTVCSSPNRSDIVLDSFDPSQDVVVVDLAALVADNNLMETAPNTPTGCMSSPDDGDCVGIMGNLGIPFGEASAPEQTVFRAE
ncbi:metallo-mystery pair system four-Cys motif protein [filamentous cyanobacterium CCP5]|nr:metallo-mystery pair system four-Cys motif protein [filamentous cyanobacterium CCP5]